MSHRRAAAVVACVVLSSLTLPAAASTAPPVVMTETVSVQTSRSSVIDVLLPEDATVSSSARSAGVRFDGPGRLVGVWLERRDSAGDFLTSYRLPAFAGGKQVTYGSGVLREGHYRLTVLTDGRPLRITLRLDGLAAGRTTLRPRDLLDSTQKTLPARESLATSLVTFGGVTNVDRPVQTFVVATARGSSDPRAASATVCERPDAGKDPMAYGPLCPGGSSGGYQYQLSVAGEQMVGAGGFATSSATEHRGPVGLGGSFGDSGGVRFGQALGVWLERP